jgi:hypothetical protein
VNSFGGAVNYGIYTVLVLHLNGSSMILPVIAVAVSSICGRAMNFFLRCACRDRAQDYRTTTFRGVLL